MTRGGARCGGYRLQVVRARDWITFVLCAAVALLVFASPYFHALAREPGLLHDAAASAVSLADSREGQWFTALCVSCCFFVLIASHCFLRRNILQHRALPREWNGLSCWPEVLLFATIGWGAARYAADYPSACSTSAFLTLVSGVALGQAVAVLRLVRCLRSPSARHLHQLMASAIVLCASVMALFHPYDGNTYSYHGQPRWMGLYTNPNSFGLVMGVGVVLAVAQVVRQLSFMNVSLSVSSKRIYRVRAWVPVGIYALSFVIMLRALLNSYSRGAWLATLCGVAYLGSTGYTLARRSALLTRCAGSGIKGSGEGAEACQSAGLRRLQLCRVLAVEAVLLLCCTLVVAFPNLREAESPLARRVFSLANQNDPSLRNRASTCRGALCMMADRPYAGFGWNRVMNTYDQEYRPNSLPECGAIALNDYLVLAVALGIPTTVCVLWYAWCKFVDGHRHLLRHSASQELNWDMAYCRAAFLTLFIGFMPEAGIFQLALGSPVLGFAGVGNAAARRRRPKREPRSGPRAIGDAVGRDKSWWPSSTASCDRGHTRIDT